MANKIRKRMTREDQEVFTRTCMELWNSGYDVQSIAHLTRKRLDLVSITIANILMNADKEQLERLNIPRSKFIVSQSSTIKRIGKFEKYEFYEASIDNTGKITLVPVTNI